MTGVLAILHGKTLSSTDMLRALGSIVTKNPSYAYPAGAAIHFTVGCLCAFLYIGVWNVFPFSGMVELTTLGLLVGFGHGLLVSFMLVIAVAEHHPLKRFREAGFAVAGAYLVAHLVYGFTVGLGAGFYEPKITMLEKFAIRNVGEVQTDAKAN
jgi:hypothetical protein